MKRNNIVYIMGAGSSKEFGLPLGNEIYEYAYKLLSQKNKKIYKELENLLRILEDTMQLLFINLPNEKSEYPPFEEVLTFIWNSKKNEHFDYDTQRLKSIFEKYIGADEVLSQFVRMLILTIAGSMIYYHPKHSISVYKNFIKSLDFKQNNISFISLNYDTILDNILNECVAEKIIEDYTYTAPLADATKKLDYPDRNRVWIRNKGVLLLKPHGSINLVYCSHHKQATYGEGYFYFKNVHEVIENQNIECPSCGHRTKPLIIPPLYNKMDFVEDTKPKSQRIIWRSTPNDYRNFVDKKMNEILSKADEIIVVGYSLPAYDYDFRSLLITGLMLNKNRRRLKLKIINKGSELQLQTLITQFKYLAGNVTVDSGMGFYDYLLKNK